ncbi:MAG: hypothetical protein ABIG39_04660 [Candidatus Micrarchaeota archaeon]
MRGLASILLVFVAAVALLSLMGVNSSTREHSMQTSSYVLELERIYYAKLDFKHAVLQSLARGASDGNTREERAENAAGKLAALNEYLPRGEAEIWCGIPTEGELQDLPRRISRAGKPLKCSSCWSASQKTIVVEQFPVERTSVVHKCISFLDVDKVSGRIGISKGGLFFTKDVDVLGAQFSGKFVLGVSYYDKVTGIGSIAVIPEGTWVDYR